MQGYTLSNFHTDLADYLKRYIEAQYHIQSEHLVTQRRKLLDSEGSISSTPYIETSRSYLKLNGYESAGLPNNLFGLFASLSKQSSLTGVVPTPFTHQIEALDQFFNKNKNIVITTGTGSGKTETFIYPTLCGLIENSKKDASDGVMKSMILYPMNALVTDQTTRLRKILGSELSQSEIKKLIGRPLTFANYTSATPYAGEFDKKKNKDISASLEKLYCIHSVTPEEKKFQDSLRKQNRLPIKANLSKFIQSLAEAKNIEQIDVSGDAELVLRQEIQSSPPDLLVTNFSMLEYMLLRPIEHEIFDKTASWLSNDPTNYFTLILDEAHLYNGVSGSEVSLLIRRFKDRIGAKGNQFRIIIASASLGEDPEKVLDNSSKLTGENEDSFEIIKETLEDFFNEFELKTGHLSLIEDLRAESISALSSCKKLADAKSFGFYSVLKTNLARLAEVRGLGIEVGDNTEISGILFAIFERSDLFNLLKDFLCYPRNKEEVLHKLRKFAKEKKYEIKDESNFYETLINIGSLASRKTQFGTEVLLPIRAHTMYRGLPGIYLCLNPKCGDDQFPFGKMYSDKRTICECGAKVFELYTHRDCGAAYLKGYWAYDSLSADIAGAILHSDGGAQRNSPLCPVLLCLEPIEEQGFRHMSLNPWTGEISDDLNPDRIRISISLSPDDFNKRRIEDFHGTESCWYHKTCPHCDIVVSSESRDTDKEVEKIQIKGLGTIGDEPFNYLIQRQFKLQPPKPTTDAANSNQGRKSLLFSDGRQKAARIAKNLPETIQRDIFRSYLIASYIWLQTDEADYRLCDEDNGLDLDIKINKTLSILALYHGFLHKCSETGKLFFEGEDRDKFEEHLKRYRADHAIAEESIPKSFKSFFVSSLCKRHYNVSDLAIADVRVKNTKKVAKDLGLSKEFVDAFFTKRAKDFLHRGAIYAHREAITEALGKFYSQPAITHTTALKGGGKSNRKRNRADIVAPEHYEQLNESFKNIALLRQDGGSDEKYLINPSKLFLNISLDSIWYQCENCRYLSDIFLPSGGCPACGSSNEQVSVFDDESTYFRARKEFWRTPVREALKALEQEMFIEVGEHTAQLNYRDNYAKTISTVSENELRFQDIVDPRKSPKETSIDILSSTTTMEVGIDIGGLIAVAMRNVPPQRQNYQQRAGRAGRRGASFSTVVTYCQNGSHDSYYFSQPELMISGPVTPVQLHPDQPTLMLRHLMSVTLGAFFKKHAYPGAGAGRRAVDIFTHLGSLGTFLDTTSDTSILKFKNWCISDTGMEELKKLTNWYTYLAGEISVELLSERIEYLHRRLLEYSKKLKSRYPDNKNILDSKQLLEVLFELGLLPGYAFPTDLVGLEITKINHKNSLEIEEQPTFGINQAIRELSPGRTVILNKKIYQIGSLISESVKSPNKDKATGLFAPTSIKTYYRCINCDTLNLREDIECCSKQALKEIDVIQPKYVVPKFSTTSITPRDSIYTQASKPQIIKSGSPVDTQTCRRFSCSNELQKIEDAEIAIINLGVPLGNEETGFQVCEKCGASSPPHKFGEDGQHQTDYPVGKNFQYLRKGEICRGNVRNVAIGFQFKTQLSTITFDLSDDILAPDGIHMPPELESAAVSLSLAIRDQFAISQDISKSEIGFGARIILGKVAPQLQLYFYDDAEGGAGYAQRIFDRVTKYLNDACSFLTSCDCDSRCYKCLSSYETRFFDHTLNRFLACSLAQYLKENSISNHEVAHSKELTKALLSRLNHQLSAFEIKVEERIISRGNVKLPFIIAPSLKRTEKQGNAIIVTPYELLHDLSGVSHYIITSFQQ